MAEMQARGVSENEHAASLEVPSRTIGGWLCFRRNAGCFVGLVEGIPELVPNLEEATTARRG